ncbi:hypothetical protein AB0M48_34540 [Lentzea sp. NPDC051208]
MIAPWRLQDSGPYRFQVDGYADDPAQEDFHAAISAFLALER